ncbi:MAG: hypothetical protein ABI414_16600 [Devosia sp.]
MPRYIVAYHAPLSARERLRQATQEEAMAGVQLWIDWAKKLGPHLIDPGRPFGRAMRVTPTGTAPANSDMVGLSVLEADSMEHALSMVEGHHHLAWAPDCSITVHEQIAIPELQA